jgi:long-chain acyl-CoA synthetase
MQKKHLAQIVQVNAKKYGNKAALRAKVAGLWKTISWRELEEKVRAVAKALLELGVREGEMVGIFSPNCPEWSIADYGILSIRGVSVPIFATDTAKRAEYIVNDAEISIMFVGGQEQYDKVISVLPQSAHLKKIIVFDPHVQLSAENSLYFHDLLEIGAKSSKDSELDARLQRASADELATLIYTSGTTGEQKGVMLQHSNFLYSFDAHDDRLDVSDKDVSMCFLPLSHVFERTWSYYALSTGMEIVYCEDTSKIIEYLQEAKPTIMCAVPRFYEKIYGAVFEKLETAPPLRKKLFFWAIKTGEEMYIRKKEHQQISLLLSLKHKIADTLILKKIQAIVGGNIRFFPCAGAPLSRKIEEFFHSAGVCIKCGYGLTETTATVTCHEQDYFRPGTVGKAIKGVEVKIEADGEILVRGPNVMKGYYKKPRETADVFAEGWFRTGDIGLLEDGYLTITDRIKDLLKTSGGKYIAPQLVETTIGSDHFIEQIIAIGDEKKFISALIVPAFNVLEEDARNKGIPFTLRLDLINNPEVIAFYRARIDEKQKDLAEYEKVKRFTLLTSPFTQESGELTSTMKIKRKVILQKYASIIDAMYKD